MCPSRTSSARGPRARRAGLPGYPRARACARSLGRPRRDRRRARGRRLHGARHALSRRRLQADRAIAGAAPTRRRHDRPDVDLTRPLPYADGAFDLVVLCEVAEHLPTYIPVDRRDRARARAPADVSIMSTPNVARLHSRWHFLWTGTHKLIRRRVGWDLSPDDLYAYHISPVDFPLLHTLLHQAGLTVERLDLTQFKWRHAGCCCSIPSSGSADAPRDAPPPRRRRARAGRGGPLPLDDASRDARERAAAGDGAEGTAR